MPTTHPIPQPTVLRLSAYRAVLEELAAAGVQHVFSHELAAKAGATPAQVRRDVMSVGYQGSAQKGYAVEQLLADIDRLFGFVEPRKMVLVGVGHLGRALLDFFAVRSTRLRLTAAFDVDPGVVGRVIHGVRCHPLDTLVQVVRKEDVHMGVVTVPEAAAQEVADLLVQGGCTGILNFAPVPLAVPQGVFVENLNLTTVFEKVAFFAGWLRDKEKTDV